MMESWTRVIVEWINCLGIAQPSIQDVHELQDCVLYHKLVSQFSPGITEVSTTTTTTSPSLHERELVSKFIKAEYPEFMMGEECAICLPDELYVASLLLTQCSQNATFHRPMCVNLKHETQVYIKKFLEMVLPYGKSVTKEIIGLAITETGDSTPNTPPSTPVVRPLRQFFNSPAARSAHSQRFMNDRNRELRRLKAQLETEQFEKADLAEDIRIQEEKIRNLQKKLHEKSRELKSLRNERSDVPTPQSSGKNKRPSDNEERYKRELEHLENSNLRLRSEVEMLRDEREELERRLTSKGRLHSALEEKFDRYERNTEALLIQLEVKNNELLSLRMNNEELREHIREIRRSSMSEQSFEMEPISRARSPLMMNSSEALSSIIDIQLQEAKEESAQLKNQLDGVNQRLEVAVRECEEIKRLNAVLRDKATELDTVSVSLRTTEERLSASAERTKRLELENSELIENLSNFGNSLESIKKQLAVAENRRDAFELELAEATSRTHNLETCLEKEKSRRTELESTVSRFKKESEDLHNRLTSTVDKMTAITEEKTALEFELHEKLEKLHESENILINEKSRITELESTVTSAKKEYKDQQILRETIEKKLSSSIEEKMKLESESQERLKRLEESETCLKCEKMRVDELKSTVARANQESRDLQNLLESSQVNLARVNDDKKTLEFDLQESKRKLEATETHLYNEKSTIAKLELILTRTNNEFENLKHRLTLNEEELSNIKENKKSLEELLDDNKKKLEESEASSKNDKSQLAELKSTIIRFQKDTDDLRNELRSNEELLAMEKARVADLESTVARDIKDSKDLRDTLEELRTAFENEKSGSAELKEIVSRSKNTCQELESLLQSKKDLLNKSLERESLLNAELEMCRLRISDLELSLRSETLRSIELESKCSRTNEHCTVLKDELSLKERVYEETKMRMTNTESELHNIIAEMRKELSHLEEEKRESLLENEKITESARNTHKEILSRQAKIAEYERRIHDLDETSKKEKQKLDIVEAKLTDRNSTIEKLSMRLEETEKCNRTNMVALETSEKKLAELIELGEEVESQLSQEREQLTTIRAEKKSLTDKLMSYVHSEADLKEQISKILNQLNVSNNNLQEEINTNASLKKNESELQDAKDRLINELTQEQQQSAVTLNEKERLEQELASFVHSAANTNKRISKIEKELEEFNIGLQEKLASNIALRDNNVELTEVRIKMENQESRLREQLTVAQTEKDALQEELSLHVRFAQNMEERIVKKEKDLEVYGKHQQAQHVVIEGLEEKVGKLKELRQQLEDVFDHEQAQLTELRSEKEMLEEEVSLYGRSNKNLGDKIIALEADIEKYSNDLENEREAKMALKKVELEINNERDKLKEELARKQEHLTIVETEKKILKEDLSVLHVEMDGSRKELQHLRDINVNLKQKVTEADARIESLQVYESLSARLNCDLEMATKECETLRARITELSEELKLRVVEITSAERQLTEVKREKDRLNLSLKEQVETSNNLVASLKQHLASVEKSWAEAKLEEKLKEESLEVVRVKLEELTGEKMESELKMKEVILNLQEVRSSQDDVLEAQARTLNEKTRRLEEAEQEIVKLRNSLIGKTDEIERETLAFREAEVERKKLKEHNQVQSKLVKELQIALEIAHSQVEKSTKRCKDLEKNVKEITSTLKLESNALWNSINKACPEIGEPRQVIAHSQQDLRNSEIERLSLTVQSFTDDAKTICRVVSMLSDANDKLKSNMKEIIQVSGSLKFELNALWDSVRRACPELARQEEGTPVGFDEPSTNPEMTKVSYAVKSFADDAKNIRKVVSILSEANETLKEHLDGEKEIAKTTAKEAEKRKQELDDRISSMESERKKRNRYISFLVQRKKNLRELLSTAVSKRDKVDEELGALNERWRFVAEEAQSVLDTASSACDELVHLRDKRTELGNAMSDINDRHARSLKPLPKAFCRIFMWSETKLQEAQELSIVDDSELVLSESELSEEQELVRIEIGKIENVHHDLSVANENIDTFSNQLKTYEVNLKSGAIKRLASVEEKLQAQVEKLSKEKKEMKDKLDAMRMRNAKMEKNMDDMRNDNKKLKTEASSVSSTDPEELERLQKLTDKLQAHVLQLQRDNDDLVAKKGTGNEDVETRLKEVHKEYEQKLEKIKQKMKAAYNEQTAKLSQEQEKALKDKMGVLRIQMEKQCRKYTEDIAKYKVHISDLSSRYWDVGEKLLAETQEKRAALRQLDQLRASEEKHRAIADTDQRSSGTQSRLKTASLDRRDFAADRATKEVTTRPGYRAVEVIEEETTTYSTRRHSVKSIQAMGNAFNAEDEESELFDSVYLTDLKEGRCAPAGPDFDRLSELRIRNSMCRPHLKSSYAVETHFQPITLNEDDIKNGPNADDVFNDSLSQSLLPGQKPKKKDRSQTSYKRPGPPTPSKNGGRLSLQGNEPKSPTSRVRRERNAERRATATPRGLKNLFGNSISKRLDENATGTPKGRRLSNIFRKQRTERN